jgi:hypothetical protein
LKIKADVDLAVSFIFNLILYLFHEDYIQPEATSSSFISFVYFRLREIDVINMVTKPRILQRNDNYFNVTRDTFMFFEMVFFLCVFVLCVLSNVECVSGLSLHVFPYLYFKQHCISSDIEIVVISLQNSRFCDHVDYIHLSFNIGQNTQNEDTQKKTISKNIKDEKSGPRQDREKRTMSNVLCRTRRMMKPR